MTKTILFLIPFLAALMIGASISPALAKEPTQAIIANGVGAILCPDGSIINDVEFFLTASKTSKTGPVTVSFAYQKTGEFAAAIGDTNADGSFKTKKFNIDSTFAASAACVVGGAVDVFTIAVGSCGPNAQVTWSNSFGEKGSYFANVLCF